MRNPGALRALLALVALAGCGDGELTSADAIGDGAVSGPDASPAAIDADPSSPDAKPTPVCDGSPPSGDGDVSGTLAVWHPVTVGFAGPSSEETSSSPNPFLDFRLLVTFTGPSGQSYAVPGFFAGDGAGGGSGDRWMVRFAADEAGDWSYEASFRSGAEVAVSLDPGAGTAADFDGATGTFCVEIADAGAEGYRRHGRLEYVGQHYLRLADGTWWIKGGADSPENFMGYAGFDNTVDQPGGAGTDGLSDGLHRYAPHIGDWNPGDPDWGDGDGKGIIGALNYLASEEVNSIYFLPCNLGGDGRETYPYIEVDDLLHFDLSKLHQWEIVFDHAERKGIALHFVLNETETENENLHDGGTLGTERKLYYRELVARFGHHLALFWNIGEENDYGSAKQIEFAEYIRAVDPYDHPTTVHTHHNQPDAQYDGLVGEAAFDMTSIQLSPDRAGMYTEQWRQESAAAGRPWAVMLDEISPADTGVTDQNASEIRRLTLWPALLSGSAGVEWYFGYHDLPLGGDMRCEDFRTRSEMWRYTRIARRFVLDNLPFWEMSADDALLSGEVGSGQVFAEHGETYAIYLPDASGSQALDLGAASGSFEVRWFNPRTGAFEGETGAVEGGDIAMLGSPPADASEDWVVLVTGGDGPSPPPTDAVTALVLINADSDVEIEALANGATLDLGALPTSNLNVRADTSPATVGSVRFGLDGNPNYRTENQAPYSLAGDSAGDYSAWTPSAGDHTLTATPYSGADASGAAGTALTVEFTVVD